MKLKKIISALLVVVMGLTVLAVPVSASTYGSQTPYTRSWLDAINDYEVIDYYEYSTMDKAYAKTATLNVKNGNVYYKTTDSVLATDLFNEQIGFDCYGNIWFINSLYTLIYCVKGSKAPTATSLSATALSFDDNNFVIGYSYNGISYSLTSNGFNTNTSNGNWSGNGNGNNTGNPNNWNQNTTGMYPYLTYEDGKLIFVESLETQNSLYVEDGYLILNNLILYKKSVKHFGFTKTGVVYINNDNKLITYKFGDKKQYVKVKDVTGFTYSSDGFITGYTQNGKSYSL